MSQKADSTVKTCDQKSDDEWADRWSKPTVDIDNKMTVTKQKSNTEYTRVLQSTTTTPTPADEGLTDISSARKQTERHLLSQMVNNSEKVINYCKNNNKCVESDDQLTTEERNFNRNPINSNNNSKTNSSMNRAMNSSKRFVPFSEQSVISNPNNETAIYVNTVDDQLTIRSPDDSLSSQHLRPNTLSVCSPIPPEFSISPADSLSKASSSDNIQESSIPGPPLERPMQTIAAKPPPSPTNLSVYSFNGGGNYIYGHGSFSGPSGAMALSPSYNSLHGSLASSINDLTVEAEQLERAIRHNDTRFVRRMLDLYNKSGTNLINDKNDSLIEKCSHSSQHLDLNTNKQLLKSQSMIDKFICSTTTGAERRESGSTDERCGESPSIFTNSLHLAIENNSFDVTLLLLKSGIDANEAGVQPYSMENWRRSSHTSDDSCAPISATESKTARLTINNLNLINSISREPLIRTPSIRSTNSPRLLSPMAGPSGVSTGGSLNAVGTHNSIYFAINSSPSSINSDLSSIGRFSTPTKVIRVRTDLSDDHKVVHMSLDGSAIHYDEEYTRENLYSLPPIFLCVALNNSAILRELIKFGANVNTVDRYGVSPLHLCLCQEHVSRSCLQLLVENGAKLFWENSRAITPVHLVSDEMSPHILTLQKSIIDSAFAQIVPKQSISNSNNNNQNNNSFQVNPNINNPLASNGRVYSIAADLELSSLASSSAAEGLNTFTSNTNIKHFKRKLQSKTSSNLFSNNKTSKDVYICLDNVSVKSLEPSNSNDDSIKSDAFPGSAYPQMYSKKSITAESMAPSVYQWETNLNSPTTTTAPVAIPQQTRDHSISSRLLNRRKSGEESNNINTFSFKKIGKTINQKFHHQINQTNIAKEKNELIYMNRADNSMQTLIKMATNLECVPFILSNLQNQLLDFISLTEKFSDGSKLHKPLAILLNKILQTIVDEICCENESKTTINLKLKSKSNTSKVKSIDIETKRKLSVQLCGLLRSGIQCLKGGQSLQFTSLLLINKIIDVLIIYDVSRLEIELNETNILTKDLEKDVKNKNKSESNGQKRHQIITQMPSLLNSDNKRSILTSVKTTISAKTSDQSTGRKLKPKHSFNSDLHSIGLRIRRKSWSKLIRGKSPKNGSVKRDGPQCEISGSTGRPLGIRLSANTDSISNNIVAENTTIIRTTLLSILVGEGIDLILNVLNNAITLHKRVTGSKQCCTSSHRLRQCTYHCLQILSARALLYASQCEDAQNRLISESPLKVLITAIDSTHDPQLICLALQILANLAISPKNHTVLIAAEIPDSLMQLILPSDEWFYTNTTTKYAKYVKHQSARIMVYLGLEKRLRHKVYLYELLEEGLQPETPLVASEEDSYIMSTSLAPIAVYSATNKNRLLGSSIEGVIFNLIRHIENKLLNGEDSEYNDPLTQDSYYFDGSELKPRGSIPPAIQVDLPSGVTKETDTSFDPFFYLSAFPTTVNTLIVLRLLQHQMFGCVSFWAWPSSAVSRSSMASVSCGSGENRSRASSTSNAALDLNNSLSSRRNVNLTINCSTASLSPARVDIERRTSLKGFVDTRVIIQTSIPITSVTLTMAPTSSKGVTSAGQQQQSSIVQPSSTNTVPFKGSQHMSRRSMAEQQMQQSLQNDSKDNTPSGSPGHQKRAFRFSSLRRKRFSRSTDASSPPLPAADTPEKNEAFIMAFQRELQNLPEPDTSPLPHLPTGGFANYSNSIASYIREALERSISPAFTRPRSCSVPRVTFDNLAPNSLQLPMSQRAMSGHTSPLIRSATAEGTAINVTPIVQNTGQSPSTLSSTLSPSKLVPKNQLNESPISGSTFRSASRSGSRSGSAGQVSTDPIMPNKHRAVLKLLHDWCRLCPNDFNQNKHILREMKEFLNRISILGDHYRWMAQEIRVLANIDDTETIEESESNEMATNQEYQGLQQLVVTGELPCSKEEAAILAGIQLRIEETWPQSKNKHIVNEIHSTPQTSVRPNISAGEKLRPICEDVKETSPNEVNDKLPQMKMSDNLTFDGLDDRDDIGVSPVSARKTTPQNSAFLPGVTKRTTSILCNWVSNSWINRTAQTYSAIDLRECLPPMYHNSKNMAKNIKEQKRKLFHSPVYESEQQLKKLYIQTCKRLPAFGCRIFQVKELLRGRTKRRATRLLGICLQRIVLLDSKTLTPAKCQPTSSLQQWRSGGGRSHDRLVLEFRGTKWSFITPSQGSLRAIGTVLWEIMQDLDARFLDDHIITRKDELDEECRRVYRHRFGYGFDKILHFRDELQHLETLLHFPEEVALRLTQVEYQLFYNVSPVHYIRQVTIGLSSDSCFNANQTENNENCLTVRELVERFNEVSSWVTHIIISQPTHEMRKAVLSCIMRIVQCCWNLGNFNSAVEILAGLKSEKLKPFWLSIGSKDQPVLKEKLCRALLSITEPSIEYQTAVIRALDIPHSKVIPFFGSFLRDLRSILKGMPSLVVLPFDCEDPNAQSGQQIKLDFIADFNGDEHYMSRIGVGGIINMEKMCKTHEVLDNIRAFHLHCQRRQQLLIDTKEGNSPTNSCYNQHFVNTTDEQKSETKINCENDFLYKIDLDSYKPIQALVNSHGVSFVPTDSLSIDLHMLQAMHHGLTCIHYEEDTSRSSVVYLQLEQSNATLVWCKPSWSTAVRTSTGTPQDYVLALNIEDVVLPGVIAKYESKEPALTGLDDGFIDLQYVKDIRIGQTGADLMIIARRHGLPDNELNECRNSSVKLLFGTNLSDNRVVEFIAPKFVANIWSEGLKCLCKQIQQQKQMTDQRISWLKERYLQLYYEDSVCVGPTPAEAIRVFGGRKWTLDAMGAGYQSTQLSSDISVGKHNQNTKIKKKKSSVSLVAIRDSSPRSAANMHSETDSTAHSPHPSPSLRQRIINMKMQAQNRTQSDKIGEMHTNVDHQSSLSYNSCDNVTKLSADWPTIQTNLLTHHYKEKFNRNRYQSHTEADMPTPNKRESTKSAITHSSQMNFIEFQELFRSFIIRSRRDVKDIFEQIATKSDIHSFNETTGESLSATACQIATELTASPTMSTTSDISYYCNTNQTNGKKSLLLGLLTRNSMFDRNDDTYQKGRIFDAIAAASIVANTSGIDTLKTLLLTATDFHAFIITYQCENIGLDEVKALIRRHEPNPAIRKRNCLSFEGFAKYLMDKDNYAYTPELFQINESDMNEPLSHYYMASSHNTYLTGHQLRGESSVELYSQVLSTGCRCVELDCWDGDDGLPVIYHGHTLTSKIPFKKVIETINEKAFIASPYPVILSIENHCSLPQQIKMAQMFVQIFADKLVTKFQFDSDFYDDPQLPSPNQLRYRILIKNKKLRAPVPPALNMKMRANTLSKSTTGRTNSLISTASTGSLNEEEDDEYEDDEDEDEALDASMPSTTAETTGAQQPSDLQVINKTPAVKTESSSSQECGSSYGGDGQHKQFSKAYGLNSSPLSSRPRSQNEEHNYDVESAAQVSHSYHSHNKAVRKSSSQIAPELSDLVIYCQAIKFRGFLTSTVSPTNSSVPTPVVKKISSRKTILVSNNSTYSSMSSGSALPVSDTKNVEIRESMSPVGQTSSTSGISSTMLSNKRPAVSAPCYQVSSVNENTAKKLCRKNPLSLISHTESQIMRAYPAGMRIDSSNFNPVIFWAFGLQSIALNYQTVDQALHINTAMFEQNGSCGLVLKPPVMRDRSHMMFGRFNPWDKEFDGLHAINLTITIISGQYCCQNTNTGSPQVEVEVIGIPVDCNRQRTKIVQRNSLNPIWNDTFMFRVTFSDLAFIRFSVTDLGTNHLTAQRVLPLNCLRQGYRHLRLRSAQNQSLPLSTIFIYSQYEEEGIDFPIGSANDENQTPSSVTKQQNQRAFRKPISSADLSRLDSRDVIGSAPVRRRMFFLVIHGVVADEPSTILKITQDSTASDVISQSLAKANKAFESANDYVLIEEVQRGWDKKRLTDRNITQRILDPCERPLEAQSQWKGEGRFVLKKVADDPSSRAWMSSIRSAQKDRIKHKDSTDMQSTDQLNNEWTEESINDTFLVCIYNVSPDQPYTILKANTSSSAADIISQALLKAHRHENHKEFALIEELEYYSDTNTSDGQSSSSGSKSKRLGTVWRRVLKDDENVYLVQANWKTKGKFELKYRKDLNSNDMNVCKQDINSLNIQKLLRNRNSIKRLTHFHRNSAKKSFDKNAIYSQSPEAVYGTGSRQDSYPSRNSSQRQTHSEGELPSDEDIETKTSKTLQKLSKKLSLRKLKVWKKD